MADALYRFVLEEVSCAALIILDYVELLLAKLLTTDQSVLWLLHHELVYFCWAQATSLHVLIGSLFRRTFLDWSLVVLVSLRSRIERNRYKANPTRRDIDLECRLVLLLRCGGHLSLGPTAVAFLRCRLLRFLRRVHLCFAL